jgi:hypothetical protein
MVASVKKQQEEVTIFNQDFIEYKESIAASGMEFNALSEGFSIIKTMTILDPIIFKFKLDILRVKNSEEKKRQEIKERVKI